MRSKKSSMLDNSYIYENDFHKARKKFDKQNLEKLYKSLYSNGRLSEINKTSPQNFNEFLSNYNKNLDLIGKLVKENYMLQHQVHQLGIKNRIKKKLGRYKKPLGVKSYVSQNELEDILNGSYVSKNFLPLVSFGSEAQNLFQDISEESFEEGLRKIQREIKSPQIKNPPLVSIIIPTKDGLHHLKRLFDGFSQSTGYSNYEVIVVDNDSEDETLEFLDNQKRKLNLRVIRNSENKSFSESNNIAAKQAKGSFLLFLNNDVSPTEGWLNHMMNTALKDKSIGAVGAKLVYPNKPDFENSNKIQHGGLGFKLENDFIRPINLNMGAGFFSSNTVKEEEKAGVTAACLLVEKKKFEEIDGFDESYWYGYEDVDLCLKLSENGYKNIINNAAVLFHYEFGTQDTIDNKIISNNRRKNIEVFKNKWQRKLYPKLWQSLLGEDSTYTNKKLHFGFIVTESFSKTAAGDYYTAKELGNALEDKGYKTSYIGLSSSSDPYDIDDDIDVLISMIDGYDIGKINQAKAVKIAWCRNWFERWANHKYFRDFDIVLTNSEKAQKFFREKYHADSYIFKIAGNKDRFTQQFTKSELADYESDICFTGNYWHVPRDISSVFDANKFKDRFKIKVYGKDWDHVKKMKPFWQGFLEYKNIPKVYAGGKIVIDDATFVVNEWGSVNSRVFDGALSGILVLTNGVEGSKNTFNGLIPTFTNQEELSELLEKYLSNDSLRQKKIEEIRNYALQHHTYAHRADELLAILKKELSRKRINIKLPIPNWDEAKQWGDLHFGLAIKNELEKKGFAAKIQILSEWYKPNFGYCNLVIRGLSVFEPQESQLNIIWNISHPEKIPLDEFRSYDYVFVASKKFADQLRTKGIKNAKVLYQCYDENFLNGCSNESSEKFKSDILFVGNTRNHFRKAVKYALSWNKIDKYNFKVYGKGWNKFIDKKYWAGEHISNSELCNYYKNAKILLNDHWDDMNEYGFASNRLFDASAVGTFIISDKNSGIADVFGDSIEQFGDEKSLHSLLDQYISNPKKRAQKSNKAKGVVGRAHTFSQRVDQLLSAVEEF